MKYKVIYIVILIISINNVSAQSLSITDLWNKIESSGNILEKKLNVEMQQEQIKVRKSDKLPVIYGDISLQRNLIIPTTPVPAIAFDPNAKEGAILPLKFSTQWNSKAGVQMEWDLFNPSRKTDHEEDKIILEKVKVEELKTRKDWKVNSTLAYASIVLATEQYKAALEDSILFSDIKNISKERFEAGRGESEEFILSQQELERKKIRLHETWAILQDANLELGRYYPLENIVMLSTNIDEILNQSEDIQIDNYDKELIKLDQQISIVQLNGIKRQLLPTLSFNAYLGSQFFSNEFNLIDKSNWYGYSYANLGLRIPISTYFSSTTALRKAKLNEIIFTKQVENQVLNDEIDSQQKLKKIGSAKQKIKGLNNILILSLQNKTEKLASYHAGRILLSDFNKANSDCIKAQQDIWQAKYDLLKIILE